MANKRNVSTEPATPAAPSTAVPEDDVLITLAAVRVKLAGVSEKTVRGLVARGEFFPYAHGGRTVYSLNQVNSYIERLKARPGRAAWRGSAAGGRP